MPSARFSVASIRDKLRMRLWLHRSKNLSGSKYWEERARFFGPRAVLNLSHSAEEIVSVTKTQEKEIFPYVSALMTGDERNILDFGCGPGRFVPALVGHARGMVIGVDPVRSLLRRAPVHPRAEYIQVQSGALPLANASIDIVWCCLVLGGIPSESLRLVSEEFLRVLTPGGKLILVENTTMGASSSHWNFRSVSDYQDLFPTLDVRCFHEYTDAQERISVMGGRLRNSQASN